MRCARGIFSTDTVARTTDFADENMAVGFQIGGTLWRIIPVDVSRFADHGQLNKSTGDPITT